MKVQEVILRAMAKKITWWEAAEIIGITDRQIRRWPERYKEFGYDGCSIGGGKPSPKPVPVQIVEQVLGLYRESCFDLQGAASSREAGAEPAPVIRASLLAMATITMFGGARLLPCSTHCRTTPFELHTQQDSPCSMDEHAVQITVVAFADAAESCLTVGGVSVRHPSEPGNKLASLVESSLSQASNALK